MSTADTQLYVLETVRKTLAEKIRDAVVLMEDHDLMLKSVDIKMEVSMHRMGKHTGRSEDYKTMLLNLTISAKDRNTGVTFTSI